MHDDAPPAPDGDRVAPRFERRPATAREAKALGHPLRLRILRLCGQRELSNKQLADRLGRDPATVLHHVRQLVAAELLEAAPPRSGPSGALEKPYRSTGRSWWLSGEPPDPARYPQGDAAAEEGRPAHVAAFLEELDEAGPASMATSARLILHLSPDDLDVLASRLQIVLDDFMASDHTRADQPAYGGIVVFHRLADGD